MRRAGQLHDERNLDRFAVEKDAVFILPVIAEPFAMIGKEDDERAVVDAGAAERVEKAADDRVGGGDLGVVWLEARPERLRRVVGGVRLVEVQEKKERLRLMRADPL